MNAKKDSVILPTVPARRGGKIEAWEKEEILGVLALTGNIRETARRTGRSPGAIHAIFHRNQEVILHFRHVLERKLRTEFVATLWETQETIRFFLARIREADDPEGKVLALSGPLFDLGKLAAIEVERYQVLADQALKITELERAETSEAEQREQDKWYVKSMMTEILQEMKASRKELAE